MKLVVLYGEPPIPTTHGGRVDVYQRLLALKKAGVEVFLVCWCNPKAGERPDEVARGVAGLVARARVFTSCPFLKRPWLLARYPGWIATKVLGRGDLMDLTREVRQFEPDAILIDGLPCAAAGLQLVDELPATYLLRSHNQEYRYVKEQARLVRGLRGRLRFLFNLSLLKSFEQRVLRRAEVFYDISTADLATWRSAGFSNGELLPPIIDPEISTTLAQTDGWAPKYDVGYLGNLVNLNNVQGVLWFIRYVAPLLRAADPGIRMLIAGSHPTPDVVEACRAASITLLPDPPDATVVLRDCRVLVNPVFQGSGVNLKSVEMLHTPAGLVATPTGVAGMPEAAIKHFSIAETPEEFAAAILAEFEASPVKARNAKRRAAARTAFSPQAIEPLISRIKQ